jgi:hypothetical protein
MREVLTDEDRDRIRHETVLRAEIRHEVEAALVEKLGLFGKLNSRVALTTIGSVFLAIITALVTHLWSWEHARAEVQRINREKKANILSNFSNDIANAINVMGTMETKRIWLRTHRAASDVDELGRPRGEVEQEFWEAWRMYAQVRKPEAVIEEVRLFFVTPQVQDTAVRAQSAIEAAHDAADQPEKWKAEEQAVTRLVDAMRDEIQRDTRM